MKIIARLITLLVSISIAACGQVPISTPAPATPTMDIQATLTKLAAPTKTPSPTPTPDTRSDYEKCSQTGYTITYILYGSAGYGNITWNNATNGTEQGEWDIPFCYSYNGFKSGDFAYISVQITSDAGDVTCEILNHGKTIAKGHATGFANIATCSSSVP